MSTPHDAFQTAVAHHQAGRTQEAARIYREVLAADPRHAEAMHLLGVVAHQSGDHNEAIRLITDAIALDRKQGAYYSNLGEACRAAGQLDAAQRWLIEAIKWQPNVAAPYYNLALVHAARDDHHATAERCHDALRRNPQYAAAHMLLGKAQLALEQHGAACDSFARALACNPNSYDALTHLTDALIANRRFDDAESLLKQALDSNAASVDLRLRMGDLKSRQGAWPEAIACYQQVLELDPDNVIAPSRWGMALQAQERFDEAVEQDRRALELVPDDIETRLNLATTLTLLGEESQAIDQYQHVLRLETDNSRALSNLAAICQQLGRFDDALEYHDRAIEASPDDATAHLNRALLLLCRGDFTAGWEEYRWRTEAHKHVIEKFGGIEWDGTADDRRMLLVHGEQGMGDALQFVRYLPLARQRVARSVLVVSDTLVPLLKDAGYTDVLGMSDPRPAIDLRISLLDLPRIFGTTLETIPCEVPYLAASEALVRTWRKRLADVPGYRVGIAWQGNPKFISDRLRSIPLEAFRVLSEVPGVSLVSLQKVFGTEQLESLADPFEVVDLRPEYDHEDGAFQNAAAVISNLDLVIAPDTAIAHLAGALGVPVWVALSARNDWRWLYQRDDSPWYPTMRLFRQRKLRDWDELFARIAGELRARVAAKGSSSPPGDEASG